MAATLTTYPDDIRQLLLKHSKDPNNLVNGVSAYMLNDGKIKKQDRKTLEDKLFSMNKLYSELDFQRGNMALKHLSEQQMSLREELAEKVSPDLPPSHLAKDTHAELDGICADLEKHFEQLKICFALLHSVGYFIEVLECKLNFLERERERKRIEDDEIVTSSVNNLKTNASKGMKFLNM